MKIVVFGGSGFVGRHLVSYLQKQNYKVLLVSRSSSKQLSQEMSQVHHITWKAIAENASSLENAAAFINLAGATINQYWTTKTKEEILQSRIYTTEQMTALIETLEHKPKVVVQASAVGIYGMSEQDTFTETNDEQPYSDGVEEDFLAHVVKRWEETAIAMQPHTRLVLLRLGVVLGTGGGALSKMILPYKFFLGGKIGSGKQWFSWIHVNDLVRLIQYCIENDQIEGPVNATAPQPVTNDEFGKTVGSVMKRPHFFPVPAWGLRLVLGEMSQMLVQGQRVLPQKALDEGFHYNYPAVEKALQDLLQKY